MAKKNGNGFVVRLMNEAEARSLRNRLDATTKGYSDRMGSSVWTSASRDEIEAALSHLGLRGHGNHRKRRAESLTTVQQRRHDNGH